MCGICGIASREKILDGVLSAMQNSLIHRGPDGAGDYRTNRLEIAVRRLSIIDLETGWQPLYNEDKSLVLICNGEIYNYLELREDLQTRGHRFSTKSDCENILHLYEDHGIDCVHFLRGMFAFALIDVPRRRLFLARDRMGEKPIYIYQTNKHFLFASELKALFQSRMVPFKLQPDAINLYFHYNYVPEPRTPIEGVRKLPAAHVLMLDLESWNIQERRYWNMEDAPPLNATPASAVREQLEEISKIITRSDVPVGIALSSGLDSSVIAALEAKNYDGTLTAFSVGYAGNPQTDERADARSLAEFLKIPFHEIELTTEDFVNFFPELVYKHDDPIADIAGYGYYAISKLAREHNVPVLLQGQAGDELFWGYPWQQKAATISLRKQKLLRKEIRLKDFLKQNGLLSGLRQYSSLKSSPPDQLVFYDLTGEFQQALTEIKRHYGSPFLQMLTHSAPTDIFTIKQPWNFPDVSITQLICNTYLVENGMAQGDRLSMASSVELRLPLADYRLVETVIGLRKHSTDLELPPKTWLKEATKDLLPEWVRNRPKKGFTPPVRQWHDALFAAHGNALESGYLVETGVLKPESGRELAKGKMMRKPVIPFSFQALVLEIWCRKMQAPGV